MDKELEELKNIFGKEDPVLAKDFSFSKNSATLHLTELKNGQLKMIITFIITAAAIIYIDFVSSQKIETSRTGFYILLGCTIYYTALQYFLFKKLSAVDPALPVLESIQQIENYKKLNQLYYGDEVVVDDEIAMEWARIPHFYYNFYVFQYATGYSAAVALSQKILQNDENAVENYLELLKSGSSDYPINVLRKAGVDMNTEEPVNNAMKIFKDLVDEMDKLI